MIPDNLRFGGGAAGTIMNPAIAVLLVLSGILICLLPRKKAIVPFLLTVMLVPADQVLVVAGLHFQVLRILIFFAMLRVFLIKGPGEWKIFSGGINKIDKFVILLALVSAIAGTLLFRDPHAVTFQLGELYTTFGTYFFLRCVIRDRDDVIRVLRVFAVIVVVLGSIMVFEQLTGRNPYALLGGARADYFGAGIARDNRGRSTASFGTPILAGVFGAVLLPVFFGLWQSEKKQRTIALIGMVGATVMTVTSRSSTPVFGYFAALFALSLWPVRKLTRIMRWAFVFLLVALQLVMKAPVYHLITRIDISGSSYHRYALIDQTVRHFFDWWLIGTKSNASWGWDMWDVSNQYIAYAISGGLLGFAAFIGILVCGFKYLGKARLSAQDRSLQLFYWGVTASLFSYCLCFFGISLWDQSVVEWYALLAIIGATAVHPVTATAQAAESPQFAHWRLPLRPIRENKVATNKRGNTLAAR